MAAFIAGKYDLGWEASGTINRVDWVQIKDTLKQRRPKIQSLEFASNQMSHIYMRTDKPPFNDVRVRRAISLAFDRQGLLDAVAEGVGVLNPAVPLALKDWAMPVDQLGEGAQFYKFDRARAKKLLAEAGYANGFPATLSYATYGSTIQIDACSSFSSTSKTSASTPSPSSRNTAHTSAPPSTASTSPWPSAPKRLSSIPTTTSSGPTWRASSRIRAMSTIRCSATC
jgi:ABC-type oligopeptide transport system substrate-binding subunit